MMIVQSRKHKLKKRNEYRDFSKFLINVVEQMSDLMQIDCKAVIACYLSFIDKVYFSHCLHGFDFRLHQIITKVIL